LRAASSAIRGTSLARGADAMAAAIPTSIGGMICAPFVQ
jgi:hypothetical protein